MLIIMTEVILVNLDNFQEYILDNIEQLKLLRYNVTVIISDNLRDKFTGVAGIKVVLTSTLSDGNFGRLSRVDIGFRGGFWKLCSMRLFYLYSYLKIANIQNTIHIENDVLLYQKLEVPNDSKVWITMDANNRCIPGIILIPDYSRLDNLIAHYNYGKTDMENLASFFHSNREICAPLPIIKQNSTYNHLDRYSGHFAEFGKIFDAAAIGQYLGGVDPRNIGGDTRGFVNETCVVDYSKYTFVWNFNSVLQIYQPHIIIDGTEIPIVNLHIHSKALNRFLGKAPIEDKLIEFEEYFISGERFQSIADVYLGLNEDFAFNPKIAHQTSKLCDITTINSTFNNPRVVFCYSHRLDLLIDKIGYFANPFVLISHNSDENITRKYEALLDSGKIIRWYAQNIQMKHPKLYLLPIGIANSMWSHGNLEILERNISNLPTKTKDFYFYFNEFTNSGERAYCKREIERKGLTFGAMQDFNSYLGNLAQNKFAICPAGNGIDCHRLWECYYLGVIPILLRSTFSEQLQELLPCILLEKWGDFNKANILAQYDNLRTMLLTNGAHLTLRYYKDRIRGE